MDLGKKHTTKVDAVPVVQQDALEEHFGSLVVHVVQGQGRITLPKDISPSVFQDLQAALLAGREYSTGLVLDWSGLSRCDVFFYQLILAARRSYAKNSRTLESTGPLPEDLRKACLLQGFGVDEANNLLPHTLLP